MVYTPDRGAGTECRVPARMLRSRTACGGHAGGTLAGRVRANGADWVVDDVLGDSAGEGEKARALLKAPFFLGVFPGEEPKRLSLMPTRQRPIKTKGPIPRWGLLSKVEAYHASSLCCSPIVRSFF